MDDERFKLNRPAILAVPVRDADLLLEAGDGDGALLYLYLLKSGGTLDIEQAAREMRLSPQAVRRIALRLEQLGMLTMPGAEPARQTLPDREAPEYQAADVVRRSRTDSAFLDVVNEAQKTLGRVLSSTDVKSLFWIYDDLALPADVIMLLIHRCKEENDERYGAERHLGMAVVKKKAGEWFDRELVTAELAEEYLAVQDQRKSLVEQVQRVVGLRGRELSPTERKYVDDWLEMGFGVDALAIAADRTMTNTGGMKWKYMNSIVKSWHSKGLHTVEEIENRDRKPADDPREMVVSSAADEKELERMRRMREKLREEAKKR